MKRSISFPRSGRVPADGPKRRRHGRMKLAALAGMILFLVAILAPAGQASESSGEGMTAQLSRAAERAARAAERASRAAARAAEKAAIRQRRATERLARQQTNQARRQALKEKAGNAVTIGCTGVQASYSGFPDVAGTTNEVVEWISIKNPPASISSGPVTLPPRIFTFAGSSATDDVPVAFPVGHYVVDIHAQWDTNGYKGNYDIHGNVTCASNPAFTIHKLQSIAGSDSPPTASTLGASVGQTVDYAITVTNTGNTPLTFADFEDPHCDAGTIVGGSPNPIEPMSTLTYDCTHTLTAADQTAGSYTNVATVTASPEAGEGASITHESNPVVVDPIGPEVKPEEPPKEETKEKAKEKTTEEKSGSAAGGGETKTSGGSSSGTSTTATATSSEPTVTGTAKSGVLGFTAAAMPSLKGPQGCVRGPFTVSIRAAGVASVTFYLDGHKLARLTSANARRGLLSIRINPAKLRIGAHHVSATITMKQASSGAKAARASRRLTVVRCKPAALRPLFTG